MKSRRKQLYVSATGVRLTDLFANLGYTFWNDANGPKVGVLEIRIGPAPGGLGASMRRAKAQPKRIPRFRTPVASKRKIRNPYYADVERDGIHLANPIELSAPNPKELQLPHKLKITWPSREKITSLRRCVKRVLHAAADAWNAPPLRSAWVTDDAFASDLEFAASDRRRVSYRRLAEALGVVVARDDRVWKIADRLARSKGGSKMNPRDPRLPGRRGRATSAGWRS